MRRIAGRFPWKNKLSFPEGEPLRRSRLAMPRALPVGSTSRMFSRGRYPDFSDFSPFFATHFARCAQINIWERQARPDRSWRGGISCVPTRPSCARSSRAKGTVYPAKQPGEGPAESHRYSRLLTVAHRYPRLLTVANRYPRLLTGHRPPLPRLGDGRHRYSRQVTGIGETRFVTRRAVRCKVGPS